MEDPKSPVKVVKPSRSSGGKASSSKPQRESAKVPSRSKDAVPRVKEEIQGGPSTGRTCTGSPQEPGKGKARRLTGRTNSGERGKGKPQSSEGRQQSQENKTPVRNSGPVKDGGAAPLEISTHDNTITTAKDSITGEKIHSDNLIRSGQFEIDRCLGAEVVEVGNLTSDQQLGLKQAEERLQRDYIHRLLKPSPEYPDFQYLCKLCSVHVENIQGAHKHIKEKRHKKNIMEKQEENELRALPAPSPAQLRALDSVVLEAAETHGISEEDFALRQAVVLRMEGIIFSLLFPVEFAEVESDFHAKVPVVFCRDVASGLMCKVSAGNDVACLTTNHLAALARLEPRLVPLVLAFRHWANTRLTLKQPVSASLGQLWLELLCFYTLEFALEEHIISIRLKELLPRELKNWPRRRLAIEDPFALKRNVARSLNSQMVFEYIQERFRTAYKYFACPQSRNGANASRSLLRKKPRRSHMARSRSLDRKNRAEAEKSGEEDEDEEEDKDREMERQNSIAPEDMHYIFDRMIFTGGKPPTVVCSICKRDGHLKDECPEDFKKIELKPLPPMTELFREILDGLCMLCYRELSPSLIEQQKREQILGSLERFIRKEYNDKAQLCLFGSSKNGFGFRDSDLDICMTLEGHDTAEKLNCKEIIEGLAKVLKKHTGLRNILPITTAKVPIVKFEHRQSGLEGDISLYNTLRCDIGDASRGSLSSYAYILMVLYFLQQRQPPVIPVLQEIFVGNTVPQRMVDGWNAFFFDDLNELRRHLPELHQNKETVGELWLGLLRFYTEEFDFKECVISIRQRKRLTTFEKQWTSKCIAIEDPFDLNHNLGAGVSRKMTNFIMKAFINGRKLFGTPFYPQLGTEADYFFDSKVLTDGELAPNDRCCRICGKIGHYMKDCPKRRRCCSHTQKRLPFTAKCLADLVCFQNEEKGERANRTSIFIFSLWFLDELTLFLSVSFQSDTRQTPPYSPQPSPYSQASVSPQNSKPSSASSTSKPSQPQPQVPQVQLPIFSFPHSHPGQYHTGLSALGLLPAHPQQPPLTSASWPIHGPLIQGSGASAASGHPSSPVSPAPMNLNDPSIIFAQPSTGRAAGGVGGGPARERGHPWHNHHLNPGPLVRNGTVNKTGTHTRGAHTHWLVCLSLGFKT
uniref:CCHC-type domain-containing protein n=1 Tax=Sinocyclocheilus rhinocerous TaxID=307959 RepID=A0A673N9C3_9TELE